MACLLGVKPGPPIAILAQHKSDLLITGRTRSIFRGRTRSNMSSSLRASLDEKSSPSSLPSYPPRCWCEEPNYEPGPHKDIDVALVSMRLKNFHPLGADENPSQKTSKGVTAEKDDLPFDACGRGPTFQRRKLVPSDSICNGGYPHCIFRR